MDLEQAIEQLKKERYNFKTQLYKMINEFETKTGAKIDQIVVSRIDMTPFVNKTEKDDLPHLEIKVTI